MKLVLLGKNGQRNESKITYIIAAQFCMKNVSPKDDNLLNYRRTSSCLKHLELERTFVTTPPVVTSQTALSPDKTVRCHCVLVPVSSPLELKIDQLRESTVIKPSPLLWRGCWRGGREERREGGRAVRFHCSSAGTDTFSIHILLSPLLFFQYIITQNTV